MNIYVGNLPLDMTEDELRQEFAAFGEVVSVTIMNDKYIGSGQGRAYGFVKMASKPEGAAAISGLNGTTMRDRIVEVVEALPLTNTNNKDNRSFHSGREGRSSAKRQRGHRR